MSESSHHSLLKRQINKYLGDDSALPPGFDKLLDAVNAAYAAFDADRAMLERSLELSSQELMLACAEQKKMTEALHWGQIDLERRVEERTAELVAANKQLLLENAERMRAEEEKRSLQEQFFQAQKMEAVGQLAGGLAHDFNNLLSSIICNCYLLQKYAPQESSLRSFADEIQVASRKGSQLITSLLAFSKKQPLVAHPIGLNSVVQNAHTLLSRVLGEDITLETVLADDELTVVADSVRMEQVLVNLATNARDAMPRGGTLAISSSAVTIDDSFVKEHGFGVPGRYAMLTVVDTGTGMDESTKERIFEPFFTTKEVGKGTGLGLAMVYGTIKQHNGFILAASVPGGGSTFSLYLPLISEPEPLRESLSTCSGAAGHETLLLAEDERAVRLSMKAVLESFGYRIIEAVDGDDAVNVYAANRDSVHLLITDIVMPRKNGWAVYQEAKEMNPDLPVLFMSGYLDTVLHDREILARGFEVVKKPVDPHDLNSKVRELLDRKRC